MAQARWEGKHLHRSRRGRWGCRTTLWRGCRGLGEVPPSAECLASLPEWCPCSGTGRARHIPKPPRSPKQTFLFGKGLKAQMFYGSYQEANALNSPVPCSGSRSPLGAGGAIPEGKPGWQLLGCTSTQGLWLCVSHHAGGRDGSSGWFSSDLFFPFCFLLLRHHFLSFNSIREYENTVLEPTASSEGGKPQPAKKS